MAGNAKISSIEALENYHRALSIFSEETLSALDRVNNEIQKRLSYLENEVAANWRREYSHWKEKLRDANRELNSSRTTSGRLAAEQLRRQSKTKIRLCEEKLAAIKEWQKRIPRELPLPQSRLLKLKTFLVNDIEKGKSVLKEHFTILKDYTDIKGDSKL